MSNEYITKHAFMDALLKLTEHQDFSKVTISQITREVDMHRQSFYYHFHDKYDLLSYTYHEISFFYFDKDQVNFDNWLEQTEKMLTSIADHKAFYTNTSASDQNTLLLTFSKVIKARLEDMLSEINSDQQLSDYDRRFYAEFFGYGCAGTLVDWIIGGYQLPPKEIAQKLAKLIQDIKHYSPQL